MENENNDRVGIAAVNVNNIHHSFDKQYYTKHVDLQPQLIDTDKPVLGESLRGRIQIVISYDSIGNEIFTTPQLLWCTGTIEKVEKCRKRNGRAMFTGQYKKVVVWSAKILFDARPYYKEAAMLENVTLNLDKWNATEQDPVMLHCFCWRLLR